LPDLLKIRWPHFRFAVSNIQLNGGQVHFDDQVFNKHHTVDQIRLGVPFMANLPVETAIIVRPLLLMIMDGSPFRLMGEVLPLTSTPEYMLSVQIKAFDLRRVAPYVADTLPIRILRGSVSSRLQLHVMQPATGPVIKIGGTINVEDVELHDDSNAPLVSFKRASVALTDVDPLNQIAVLGDVGVDDLAARLVRYPGGNTNFTPFTSLALSKKAAGAKNAGFKNGESAPFYIFVRSFDLKNSDLEFWDKTTGPSIALALRSVHVGFKNFTNDKQAPAVPFQVEARLGDGSLGLTGNLDLAHSHAAAQAALHNVDLRPVQGLAHRFWAGSLTSGKLNAKAQVQTDFAPDKFNVLLQPADLSVASLKFHGPGETRKPVELKNLSIVLEKFDLHRHRAEFKEVHLDGLSLSIRRSRDGIVSLGALHAAAPLSSAAGPATKPAGRPTNGTRRHIEVQNQPVIIVPGTASKPERGPASAWQYQIASIVVENVEAEVEDDSAARPIILEAAPLNVHLKNVSSDLSKPIALNIDTNLKPYGGFEIDGTVVVNPLAANIHVLTTRIDLMPAGVYFGSHLNAKLTRAALTLDGDLEAARKQNNFILSYNGNIETEVKDASAARPIILKAAPLSVHLEDVSSDFSKPITLNINAALKPYGAFKIDGTVGVKPPAATLHVVTSRLDLSPADAYLRSHLNAKLSRALLTSDGALEAARSQNNFTLRYRGNATLGNLRMTDKVTNEKFLSWAALRASRIDASAGDGAPRVAMGDVLLANFYARVILNNNAKLNLSDLLATPNAAPESLTEANPGRGHPQVSTARPQQAPAASIAKSPTNPDIRVGRITLQDGTINYTDNFIRPYYTVNLANLEGKIDGFGTHSTKPAGVEVRGLINSVSPIDITGSIDPLAPEAFVDIKAQADGYQMINFSPYSAKYLGYPITMGTLKLDVHYLVQNSQISATNHLFISRLSLGDKVPSPSAKDLPIASAVALLKNRRGEIDITLPVSGSLNDPRFSLGGLFWQALKNMTLKVVEAPFSLLASVAGAEGRANQDLQHVAFSAGVATLTPAAKSQLSIVAKAMQSRPAIRLTLTPRVDPSTDRPGLGAAMVDRLVKREKVEEIIARGGSADEATVELTPDEYDKYLRVVYEQATFDKPRNFLRLERSLPPDEMKKLLAENMKVTDDDLRGLAIARVVAVGHYLDQHIDPVRLAVLPPNIRASETNDKGPAAGVDLAIY
jgi:hypothetical protein